MMQRDRTTTARAVAIVLGYLSLYPLARDIFTALPWLSLGALAIRAFNPQFLFSTSSVNNGVLVHVGVNSPTIVTLSGAKGLARRAEILRSAQNDKSVAYLGPSVLVTLLGAAMIWWSVRAVTGAGCLTENYVLLGKVRVQ